MRENPAAIITGSRRGIGRAIARDLAKLGYNIVINYVGSEEKSPTPAQVKEEIEALGVFCITVRGDVANADDRQTIKTATEKAFGRCDLLVNNAGVAPRQRTDILSATEESFERVMRINLQGPYFLTQLIANWMIQQQKQHPRRQFRIVNIGSISAFASTPARGEYCISKAAMGMMTALYADRLAEFGIGVFEIRPGITATDMTEPVKDKYDRLITEGLVPARRWGQPEDIAKNVAAIARGLLDFCTGQILNCDGGFHLRRL